MKRFLLLAALLLMVICLLSGCSSMNQAIDQYVGSMFEEMEQSEDDSQEPAATTPPLTAPVFTDRAATYQYYNVIAVGDTLEELTAKYGEPLEEVTENGTSYTWIMEDGYGFCATFFEDGILSAKILYYEDLRQLAPLSKATNLDNASLISDSYTLDTVKSMFGGRGLQIAAMVSDSSDAPEISYLYVWIDEAGKEMVQVLFNAQGTVEQVVYSMGEQEAE